MLAERTLPTLRMFLAEWTTDEEFLAVHDCPFLLVSPADDRISGEADATEPHSVMVYKPAMQEWQLLALESLVLPLRKRSGANAFANLVTIGRGPNNDLILPFTGISKFHAYFTYTGGMWSMWDGKSRNGSRVRGRPIEAGKSVEVGNRDQVHLGEHEAKYFSLDGMLELMRELRVLLDS